jgi:hypothetical protein
MKEPYRTRTAIRGRLPWFLINLGFAKKGKDCEASGGHHEWYNRDGESRGCYHCKVVQTGQLWKKSGASGEPIKTTTANDLPTD